MAIFYLFSVPRPLAMASIVFLAGLVPFLTWLVFIPTAVGRYIESGPLDAALFFLAASILVHVAELFIRPYIVYSRSLCILCWFCFPFLAAAWWQELPIFPGAGHGGSGHRHIPGDF